MFAIHGLNANRFSKLLSIFTIILSTLITHNVAAMATTSDLSPSLGLAQSIDVAVSQDIWHRKNDAKRDSSFAIQEIDAAMPNPTLGLGIANIASDTLRFNQERMTQFKVSLSQQFLRGDSAHLSQKMQQQRRAMFPIMAQEREANVAFVVAQLWLNAFSYHTKQLMIVQEKSLLNQLILAAQRRYEVGDKGILQGDIIMAQVELAVLEDRINQLQLSADVARQKLRQWLPSALVDLPLKSNFEPIFLLLDDLPKTDKQWSERLYKHPALFSFIKMHHALTTGVDIAAQQRKIQWGVNASYGARANDPAGDSRSDLLSLGVTMDVPMFNSKSNDSKVAVARNKLTMHQTDRLLLLKSMIGQARSEQEKLRQLNTRAALYQDKLLPQTAHFVQVASAAYRNDKGNFSSIIRASLAKLNRDVEAFDISIQRQLSVLTLNYLLTQSLSNGANDE